MLLHSLPVRMGAACGLRLLVWRLAAVALLAAPAWGSALAAEPPRAWALPALLEQARTQHPNVQARQHAQAAALAELNAAQWQRWPTPGVQVQQDDAGRRELVLFAQQPLWSGGQIAAGIDAAQARHLAAAVDVAQAQRELALRLLDAYTEARRRQAQQALQRHNVEQHERLLALIQRRVAQQVSPPVDRELAQARLQQAGSELSLSAQALALALARLSELAGEAVLALAAETAAAPAALPGSLQQAFEQAQSASPRLARLRHELQAAAADVRAEQGALWPRLSLRLEHRQTHGGAPTAQPGSDARALLALDSQFGAGLSQGARVQAALARQAALASEHDNALRELQTEVTELWQQLAAARLRVEGGRIQRDSTRAVFESYNRQYAAGLKSWMDLLNAVRESTLAAVALEDAQAEALRAALRLQQITASPP